MRPSDRSADWRTAMRLSIFATAAWKGYVLVQRGFPNEALAVARTRRELATSILPVMAGRKTFKQWACDAKRHAQTKRDDSRA